MLIVSAGESGGVHGSSPKALGTTMSRYSNRCMDLAFILNIACKTYLKMDLIHVQESNVADNIRENINNSVLQPNMGNAYSWVLLMLACDMDKVMLL